MASIGPCQGNSGAILDQDAVSDDGTSAVSFKENVMPASPAAQKSLGAPLALVIAPRPVTRIKLGKSVGLLVVAPQGADRTLEAPLSSMQLAIVAPENFAANTTAEYSTDSALAIVPASSHHWQHYHSSAPRSSTLYLQDLIDPDHKPSHTFMRTIQRHILNLKVLEKAIKKGEISPLSPSRSLALIPFAHQVNDGSNPYEQQKSVVDPMFEPLMDAAVYLNAITERIEEDGYFDGINDILFFSHALQLFIKRVATAELPGGEELALEQRLGKVMYSEMRIMWKKAREVYQSWAPKEKISVEPVPLPAAFLAMLENKNAVPLLMAAGEPSDVASYAERRPFFRVKRIANKAVAEPTEVQSGNELVLEEGAPAVSENEADTEVSVEEDTEPRDVAVETGAGSGALIKAATADADQEDAAAGHSDPTSEPVVISANQGKFEKPLTSADELRMSLQAGLIVRNNLKCSEVWEAYCSHKEEKKAAAKSSLANAGKVVDSQEGKASALGASRDRKISVGGNSNDSPRSSIIDSEESIAVGGVTMDGIEYEEEEEAVLEISEDEEEEEDEKEVVSEEKPQLLESPAVVGAQQDKGKHSMMGGGRLYGGKLAIDFDYMDKMLAAERVSTPADLLESLQALEIAPQPVQEPLPVEALPWGLGEAEVPAEAEEVPEERPVGQLPSPAAVPITAQHDEGEHSTVAPVRVRIAYGFKGILSDRSNGSGHAAWPRGGTAPVVRIEAAGPGVAAVMDAAQRSGAGAQTGIRTAASVLPKTKNKNKKKNSRGCLGCLFSCFGAAVKSWF